MSTRQVVFQTSVGYDIIDASTDLRTVNIPDPTNATIVKVRVTSMSPANGTPTIEVRNAASGGGSAITVTFVDTEYSAEKTGSLSLTGDAYVRSGTVGGLADINVYIYVVWS